MLDKGCVNIYRASALYEINSHYSNAVEAMAKKDVHQTYRGRLHTVNEFLVLATRYIINPKK